MFLPKNRCLQINHLLNKREASNKPLFMALYLIGRLVQLNLFRVGLGTDIYFNTPVKSWIVLKLNFNLKIGLLQIIYCFSDLKGFCNHKVSSHIITYSAPMTTTLTDVIRALSINKLPSQNTTPVKLIKSNSGANMVRPTAKKWSQAGKALWGCPKYPDSKGTRVID